MKTKIYSLVALMLISTGLYAGPRNLITAKVNGGNWSNPSTWSNGSVPSDKDSIVIRSGYTVNFDNSYTLNNVYILVGGTLNFNQNNTLALDASSIVNIVSGGALTSAHPTPNELLTINGATKYDGKNDVTITGPASATALTGSSPSGFSVITLPVTFVSFVANRTANGTVELTWNTADEVNNSHFEIERSTNGAAWESIGTVAAGTSALSDSYMFADENAPVTTTQYRIRQVDIDGNYEYSKIVMVNATFAAAAQATIIGQGKTVTIFAGNASGNRLIVRLITLGGQVLQQQSFESTAGRIDLNLTTSTTGIYVVQVTDGSQWSIAKKVML